MQEKESASYSNYLTPKIELAYSDLKLLTESDYHQVFEGKSVLSNEFHTIRALNTASNLFLQDTDKATTLFIQELLRQCATHPDSVLIDHFDFCENKIVYVTQKTLSLQQILEKEHSLINVDVDKMLNDVLKDINFLLSTIKLSDVLKSIQLQDIYRIGEPDNHRYCLANWPQNPLRSDFEKELAPNGSKEVYRLGIMTLKMMDQSLTDTLDMLTSIEDTSFYTEVADSIISGVKLPGPTKALLRKMLIKDPTQRLKAQEIAQTESKLMSQVSKAHVPQSEESKSSDKMLICNNKFNPKNWTVKRFNKMANDVWACNGKADVITFQVSNDIHLTGIGLYVPCCGTSLFGTIKVVEGSDATGPPVITKDVHMVEDMQEAKDSMYSVYFEQSVAVKAGKMMTIVCELQKGYSFKGEAGKEIARGEDGVTFTFFDNSASKNGTKTHRGQIPEIYYSE